ncbi:receptor-like protein 7 [Humulus lupulus]|uniref:receptor-like protein 7 n=1 Tax=Humulus lupulus TaxID=3486 RepID=UPI002B4038FB|nr:receptor-like protein 7 [Humulus lupulus]
MEYCSSWLMVFLCLVLLLSQSLSLSSIPSSSMLCHPAESFALLQFNNSFSINPKFFEDVLDDIMHPKTVFWKNGTDCCSWDGVLCDSISSHVIALNLSTSCLQGPLHSNNTLFSLSHLQTLILDNNDFYGSQIPPEFGNFANLKKLSLDNANFSGCVPIEISHLSKLSYLSFSSSSITRQKYVYLETFVLKRMLQNFTKIKHLSLSDVAMSDVELVTSFVNVSYSLMLLDLYQCGLQGRFPENVFRLPHLHHLDLGYNYDLTGSLPTFNWRSPLRYLDLSQSRIFIDLSYLCTSSMSLEKLYLQNCSFKVSSYPKMWTNLTQLENLTDLSLSDNNFGSQIRQSFPNLQHLNYLDLSGNNFVGNISEISKTNSTQILLRKLDTLFLSNNLLTGSIPSWIYSLPFLFYLRLDGNNLTGPIKEFQSKSLEHLYLGSNKLSGRIPSSLFQHENIASLDISSNNLDGILELNTFSMLKNLEELDLSFNNFTVSSNKYVNDSSFPQLHSLSLASCNISAFPYFLKSMKSLKNLQLSHNQIHGRIPEWLWNQTSSLNYMNISHNSLTHVERISLKSLTYLDLRSNMIQGDLPIVPISLRFFFISNNQLSGEIPSAYCNLRELIILDFSSNNIHGKIPPCIGNNFTLVLDLHMNNLSGEIPHEFGNLIHMRSLHLSENQLEGPLPQSLRNCTNLTVLDVGNNKINDIFPHWLEELPSLQVLVLKSNKFHGSIGVPKVKSPFHKLQILDLSNNEFGGLLPTKHFEGFMAMMDGHTRSNLTHIGSYYYQDSVIVDMKGFERLLEKIISIFITIDFSRNNFEGEIPKSIGMLKSLKGLNFSQNKLNGSIPLSLINLSNLEWFDLSSNELVGEIPDKMTDLTQLSYLNLSHNNLVGSIPRGNQFDTFNNDSYSGNNELCGPPLSKLCNNDKAKQSEDDHGEHANHGIFDWKIVMMGYGCGMIIGISIGYIVLFTTRSHFWIKKMVGDEIRGRHGRRHKTDAHLRRS